MTDEHTKNAEKFFSSGAEKEPTRKEKEACFKLWLESYWNEGPFTDISGKEIFEYPSSFGFLDLPGLSGVKTEKVATLYDYGTGLGFFGVRQTIYQAYEMMMLDFILLDLADELGYDLIELQNEEHWQLYLANKEQIEKEGWIPYDGKGMPEGLWDKQVTIWCFPDSKMTNEIFFPGRCWWWAAWQLGASCIAFYKVKEETKTTSVAEESVGNTEDKNV